MFPGCVSLHGVIALLQSPVSSPLLLATCAYPPPLLPLRLPNNEPPLLALQTLLLATELAIHCFKFIRCRSPVQCVRVCVQECVRAREIDTVGTLVRADQST